MSYQGGKNSANDAFLFDPSLSIEAPPEPVEDLPEGEDNDDRLKPAATGPATGYSQASPFSLGVDRERTDSDSPAMHAATSDFAFTTDSGQPLGSPAHTGAESVGSATTDRARAPVSESSSSVDSDEEEEEEDREFGAGSPPNKGESDRDEASATQRTTDPPSRANFGQNW